MKKLMIFAVAAIALVACSKEFDTNKSASNGTAIGFRTWTETLTKTVADPTNPRVQGTNFFRSGDGIVVYGSKTDTDPDPDVTSVVFDGVDVVATAEGGDPVAATAWDYNNHRFWDANAESYTFFAVSPKAKLATTTTTATDGAFVSSSLDFTGAVNDILVADKVVVNKGSAPYFNNYATVNLIFNHAAALVDLHVKKAPSLADAAVKVSAIAISNVKKTGVLELTSAKYNKTISTRTTVPNITVAEWTASAPGTYLPAEGVNPVYGDVSTSAAIAVGNEKVITTDTDFDAASPATPAASTILFNNLVVVPQTFVAPSDRSNPEDASNANAQKVTITYTITPDGGDTNTYTSTLWLYDFDGVDNDTQAATYIGSWAPGKHYIFYITIDAHEIKFSASINPWEETISGYNYLLN